MALEGFGPKLLKVTVFSFNWLLCAAGLILASVMGFLARENQFVSDDAGFGRGSSPFVFLAVVAGAVAFAAGLGCFGALRESEYSLLAFIGCLLVLFACQLSASTWVCGNQHTLQNKAQAFYDSLHDIAEDRSSKVASGVRRVFHWVLNCCGKPDGIHCPQTRGRRSVVSCHERVREFLRVPTYFMYTYLVVFILMAFAMSCGMALCVMCAKEPQLRQRGDQPVDGHEREG